VTLRFGVLDTEVDCWIGDDDGPRLFDDEDVARVSAAILGKQVAQDPTLPVHSRFRAAPYTTPAGKKRDMLEIVRPCGDGSIIRELERGE